MRSCIILAVDQREFIHRKDVTQCYDHEYYKARFLHTNNLIVPVVQYIQTIWSTRACSKPKN